MICSNCGEEIADGMKFCGMCGTPVLLNKKCISCGAEMPVKMKFCPQCGVQQIAENIQPEAVPKERQQIIPKLAPSEEDEFLTVEKMEFKEIEDQFYNCSCDSYSLYKRIEKIYAAHSTDRRVLEIYLPLLADIQDDSAKVLDIIKNLNKDILSVYLIAVDFGIEQDNLSVAETFLNKAKKISLNDPLVLCRECCLMLAMYKQYKTQSFLNDAVELSKTISEIKTADAIVKSWQLRIMSMIMKQNGEKVPRFDLDFCKENNLKYRIVAFTGVICSTEKLKKIFSNPSPDQTILLNPGTYHINFSLDKAVTIKGIGEIIFFLEDDLKITADIKLSGIKFVGNKTLDDDDPMCYPGFEKQSSINILDHAKLIFEDCIFDRCSLNIYDKAEVSLSTCEICNVFSGINAYRSAAVIFKNGCINNVGYGIDSDSTSKCKFEGLKISNCIGGIYTHEVSYPDCDVAGGIEINACDISFTKNDGIFAQNFGIRVHSYPAVISNCKVHEIDGTGYDIQSDGAVITNCEAYNCSASWDQDDEWNAGVILPEDIGLYRNGCYSGFEISGENIVLEHCKSHDNNRPISYFVDFDKVKPIIKQAGEDNYGFIIRKVHNITLKDCEAFSNRIGFWSSFSDEFKVNPEKNEGIVFEHCKSHDNGWAFVCESLISSCTVLYKECEVYENNSTFGFYRYWGRMIFEQCKSDHPEDASLFKQYSKPSKRVFIDMVDVEGGSFKNYHKRISVDSFKMSRTQITNHLYNLVMHKEPQPDEDERWPACQIKWEDAINFCNELSKLDGRKPCYSEIEYKITCNFNANGYRLPTEAEWNYAALGGINHDNYTYSGSDDIDEVAWYKDNSYKHLHEVATKKPNSLGIYDMTGNVWEWCWEEYGSNDHVFRGGCYLTDLERCPIFMGDNKSNSRLIGFRVVCSVL